MKQLGVLLLLLPSCISWTSTLRPFQTGSNLKTQHGRLCEMGICQHFDLFIYLSILAYTIFHDNRLTWHFHFDHHFYTSNIIRHFWLSSFLCTDITWLWRPERQVWACSQNWGHMAYCWTLLSSPSFDEETPDVRTQAKIQATQNKIQAMMLAHFEEYKHQGFRDFQGRKY